MSEPTSIARTLLSAATSGLVAGVVLLLGWALGPSVQQAWAASPDSVPTAGALDPGPMGFAQRKPATALDSDEACDSKRCESKSGSFARLSAGTSEVRGQLTSRGKTDLQGPTEVSGPIELKGATHLRGPTEADATVTVKKDLTVGESLVAQKDLTVGQSLVVRGDLQVQGTLEVLGKLHIKGKMDFPSKEVSCVDTKAYDQKDKACLIGQFGLCVPTRQSGICDLERSQAGSWTLYARNPRGNGSPSRCTAICF